MTLVPFNPQSGLNSDDTTFSAEGRWADGNNVRFVEGKPQTIGESVALVAALGGAVYNIFAWDRSGTVNLAYAIANEVYIGVGLAAPTARTPVGMGTSNTAFAFAAWGSTLLFVPTGNTLFEQSGTSTATEVTQAPDKITWMLVTPERQVLAFGCNEVLSGTFNSLCIRGCELEDHTNWTPTSANNSFEDIIDGSGSIVAARMVGSYVAVWTDNALHMGQFLGDPAQTYRWDRIADNCGLVGPNAVAVVGSQVYWMGRDLRIRLWSPGADVAILPCPIYQAFIASATLNTTNTSLLALAHNARFNELWVFHRGPGYVAVSLDSGAWSKGDLDRYSAYTSDSLYSLTGSTHASNFLTGSTGGAVYATDCGLHVSNQGVPAWHIQSADQYLDNGQRRLMVRGIASDFEAQASNVSLTIYARDRPGAAAVTKGPYTLQPAAQGYLVNGAVTSGSSLIPVDSGVNGIPAGAAISFAGINGWSAGADTGAPARFTLTADYVGASGVGGTGILQITPAITSSGAGRNVVSLPADNSPINVIGATGKKDLRASGRLISVKLSGGNVKGSYMRLGKPVFDVVPLGER